MKYEVDMIYCEVDKPVSIDCPIVRVMFALLCFFFHRTNKRQTFNNVHIRYQTQYPNF